jgi:glycosyl hydrolase family 113
MKNLRVVFALMFALGSITILASCGGGSGGGGNGGGGNGGGGSHATITSVQLSCVAYITQVSQANQCTAGVTGLGNFNQAVSWSASAGTISSSGLLTAPPSAGNVTVTATAVGDASKSATATVKAVTNLSSNFQYEGVTHVSWSTGEYSSPAGTTSRNALAADNGNWAGVLVTWYMSDLASSAIAPHSGGPSTPSDADVIAAITELHNKGMKVMLKPHVDSLDGTWRGAIAPLNVPAWFTNFNTFILHYANLAQANGVEMLCFGTEYSSMSGSANLVSWTDTINQIRNAYSGPLAYAANASSTSGDEYTHVSFWNQVDVIGLDGYFSLTNHANPTLAELVAAWTSNKNGENLIAAVQNFAAAHPNQPVIFTEIGYRSVAGGNIHPWDFSTGTVVSDQEQRDCMEAMYEVWSQQTAIKGDFWWAWPVNPPVLATDTDYNPRNKPAEAVLQAWQ